MPATPCCILATYHHSWPFLRQTEDGQGRMSSCLFSLDQRQKADWLAVFDEPPINLLTCIPKERRILFITEPPEVKVYSPFFLRQFGTVISPYAIRGIPSSHLLLENACLNWHYAVDTSTQDRFSSFKMLQDFRDMPVPAKTRLLSVICSTKTFTTAQKKRIAFVKKLKERLGTRIDIFGRGRCPIDDKAEAIAPYKYHLVLENNYMNNFWTEKLSDAWLGYAFPLYLGAPNASSHFPHDGMLMLHPDDDEYNLEAIVRLLDEDPWTLRLPILRQCRDMVLRDNNLFTRLERLILESDETVRRCPPLLKPERIHGNGRLTTALLRRAARYGLYNPCA